MLRAQTNQDKALTTDLAALLEERDPFKQDNSFSSDIQLRLT